MISRLKALLWPPDHHIRDLARGTAAALIAKAAGIGAAFMFNVVIARYLGADGAGAFFLASTITVIASTFGRLGLDNTIVRFISSNMAVKDPQRVRGAYILGVAMAGSASAVMTGIVFVAADWLADSLLDATLPANLLRTMALAIVPYSLFMIVAESLKGLRRIFESSLVMSAVMPLTASLGVALLVPPLGNEGAAVAYLGGCIFAAIVGIVLWRLNMRGLFSGKPRYEYQQLVDSAMPLMAVSVVKLVLTWFPMLSLGLWGSAIDAGLFGVAQRTAMLTTMILVAVNAIAAPKFAAIYRQGDKAALSGVAAHSVKLTTLAAAPVVLTFMVLPAPILAIFGAEFREGAVLLVIMALGQFVNVATGPVGFLLSMTGHERILRNNVFLSSVICIGSCFVLVPSWGALGAAIATAVSIATQNLLSVRSVWRYLGIKMLPAVFYRAF